MKYQAINFEQKFSLLAEHWAPRVIAEMNDYQFKIVRLKGDFIWHDHPETDETFVVIDAEYGEIMDRKALARAKTFAPFRCGARRADVVGSYLADTNGHSAAVYLLGAFVIQCCYGDSSAITIG
jgi:hypothetical protein